jgi:hypothetical protein
VPWCLEGVFSNAFLRPLQYFGLKEVALLTCCCLCWVNVITCLCLMTLPLIIYPFIIGIIVFKQFSQGRQEGFLKFLMLRRFFHFNTLFDYYLFRRGSARVSLRGSWHLTWKYVLKGLCWVKLSKIFKGVKTVFLFALLLPLSNLRQLVWPILIPLWVLIKDWLLAYIRRGQKRFL